MKLLTKLKGKYLIACSGGADSMAALHYLNSRRDVQVAGVINIIHNDETNFCHEAADLVSSYAKELGTRAYIYKSNDNFTSNREHLWREERYKYMIEVQKITGGVPIVTAHHLDDAVETYIMSFLKSGPNHTKIIPYERRSPLVKRPFLLNKKEELRSYCHKWAIPFLDDPLNELGNCDRSIVRHQLLPLALSINQGLYKQVQKMYRDELIM